MTVTKPKICEEILLQLQAKTQEEKQVIVHCCFPGTPEVGSLIRIWRSTYLVDKKLRHKSQLVHAENISIFPYWTEVPPMKDFWFTLIFTGLPKDCEYFELREEIPQEGGFVVKNIRRNGTDIYRIKISE